LASRTWIGGGGNNEANNPNNWSPTGAPKPGDDLTDSVAGSTIDIRGKALAGDTLTAFGGVTISLSHLASVNLSVPIGDFSPVTANVTGVDTLNATLQADNAPAPGATLDVNLNHAILFGSFDIGTFGSETITSTDKHSVFVNNATDVVNGGKVVIDADVLGHGTFNLAFGTGHDAQVLGASLEFGGSVSRGQTVSVSGGSASPNGEIPPVSSSVKIDQPTEFLGTVDLHDFSLADLVGLSQAAGWSYKDDMLSIKNACGKVIDRLQVVSDASSTGGVHGLSVSKTAAGDVLVSPGADFHGSLALPMI
jgi:hypothetical protein